MAVISSSWQMRVGVGQDDRVWWVRDRGKGRGRQRLPPRKLFISKHEDEAMKIVTFEVGKAGDATNFVKSIETYTTCVGRSGRGYSNQFKQILRGQFFVRYFKQKKEEGEFI